MSKYQQIELPAPKPFEGKRSSVSSFKVAVTTGVTVAALTVAFMTLKATAGMNSVEAFNFKRMPAHMLVDPDTGVDLQVCEPKLRPNSYACIYGGPGVDLNFEDCTLETWECKPRCDDVTACFTDCQCSDRMVNDAYEICNREMVKFGSLSEMGFCAECTVLGMMECLLHPCFCKLVDLIDRCVAGQAADACVAYKEAGCENGQFCAHHDFLKSGGQGFHYLGGSNILDPDYVDRTGAIDENGNYVQSSAGAQQGLSTSQGGASVADAAADQAAMEAAQLAQAK
jgi:hypothetical protein